jgi:hypothetical protein
VIQDFKGILFPNTLTFKRGVSHTHIRDTEDGRSTPSFEMVMKPLKAYMVDIFLFWGIGHYLVIRYQIKFAEDVGYRTMFGALVFASLGVSSILGYL